MPYEILKKQKIAENTYEIQVDAPDVAKNAQAGQFIILRIDETGERIPLTIADYDKKTVTIVFLAVGRTTQQLSTLRKGDLILDFAGPLGNKSEMREYGTVCLMGGGLGIAPVYPIAKSLKKAGNKIITILGAKDKSYLFWESNFKEISDDLMICTDNGSKGRKGFVSDALREIMQKRKIDLVIAIGPPVMMKAVSGLTRQRIKTIVSLNTLMIDGTGMCGGCRVSVDGKMKFACCDGPEFNGHKVDWDSVMNRNKTYVEEERCALEEYKKCQN